MIVFKNYFKVAKPFLPMIIIYTCIFVAIATITSTNGIQTDTVYQANQTNIAFINRDNDTKLTKAFLHYIKDNAHYIDLKDDESEMRDALFFRKVDYIMIIPKNFTEDFLNQKDVKIETMDIPDSYTSIYSKTLMNRYLNTAQLYLKSDMSLEDIVQSIQKDLNQHSPIEMKKGNVHEQISSASSFYNFSNFTFQSITIVVIAMVMLSFHEEKVKKRSLVSATSYQSFNRQLLLANIITALGIWLLYVVVSLILYQQAMLTYQGLLLILNSLIFMIFVFTLSFFLTIITNRKTVIDGISTVIGLGTSFIAGAFVPQELLSDFVLSIAKLTPSYWYISNNNEIAKISSLSWETLQPIMINMTIILGFALFFYICIQITSYLKLKKN